MLDIYGPIGLRELLRTTLRVTYSRLGIPFRLHELLYPDETSSEGVGSPAADELPGSDIHQADGFWSVLDEKDMSVKAGPILHTGESDSIIIHYRLILRSTLRRICATRKCLAREHRSGNTSSNRSKQQGSDTERSQESYESARSASAGAAAYRSA